MNTPISFLIALAFLIAGPAALAQPGDGEGWTPERRQEIKAQQSAYLTRRMNLSPQEAQRFWPIHNQFDDALEAQRKEHRARMKSLKAEDAAPSEADANTLLDQRLALREQELALRRQYDAQFRKSIGAVKTWELYQAERDFHREMLRSMRREGPEGPKRGRP